MKLFFKILAIIFTAIAIIFNFWLNIASTVFSIFVSILMAGVLASIFRLIFKSLKAHPFKKIFFRFFLVLWGIWGFALSILLGFIYYQNHINPLNLPNIVLQNDAGQKVVFGGMMHIAKENFYKNKNESFVALANENYTILVEAVQDGSDESSQKINDLMGFNFMEEGYERMASLLGLTLQTFDNTYQNIDPNRMQIVDISIDDVVNLTFSGAENTTMAPVLYDKEFEELEKEMLKFSPREKEFVQMTMYAMMNFIFKFFDDSEILASVGTESTEAKFLNAILVERNKPVIEYIKNHPDENIAVVYGSLHFQGILDGLKSHDPSWTIVSTENFFPLK